MWDSLLVMEPGCAGGRGFAAGAKVGFHPARKLVRFYLLKCPIPNSKFARSTRGFTDHLRLPLMRHPATLKTMHIPANYYYYYNNCKIKMCEKKILTSLVANNKQIYTTRK